MLGKAKHHLGNVSTPLSALVAIMLLFATAHAHAGWMPRGISVTGAVHALKKNLGESVDLAGQILDAAIKGDTGEVRRLSEEMKKLPGKIVKDAFPVLAAGAGAVDLARSSGQKLKEGLKSAERKIGRFVAGAGETGADARAALAIDEGERDWYESGAGILGKAPLPKPAIAIASSTPNNSAGAGPRSTGRDRSEKLADKGGGDDDTPGRGPKAFDWSGDWSVAGDSWSGWDRSDDRYDDEIRHEARIAYFALHCWGMKDVTRNHPLQFIMEERMEDNNCPNENAEQGLTGDREDRNDAQDDYAAALSALEAREAEALREAEWRQQEEAERLAAERRQQEEAERLAAERRRQMAEEREQREFAAARRSQQAFQDAFNQNIQLINQQLQMLQSIRAGQGQSGGSGSDDDDVCEYYYRGAPQCGSE